MKGEVIDLTKVPDKTFAAKLLGGGFKSFIKSGDNVKAGDKLLEVDLNLVKEKAKSPIASVVVTNSEKFNFIKGVKEGKIELNDEFILGRKY